MNGVGEVSRINFSVTKRLFSFKSVFRLLSKKQFTQKQLILMLIFNKHLHADCLEWI